MPMKVRYETIDGEVMAETRDGVDKQYIPDSLGNTIALMDDTQTITDTFSYWPYGEVLARTGTTETALEYIGTLGYYSDETGNSYVRSRYFSGNSGRWLSEDPIRFAAGDLNFFRYVGNRPVSVPDPSGLQDGGIIIECLKLPPVEECSTGRGPVIQPAPMPPPTDIVVGPIGGPGKRRTPNPTKRCTRGPKGDRLCEAYCYNQTEYYQKRLSDNPDYEWMPDWCRARIRAALNGRCQQNCVADCISRKGRIRDVGFPCTIDGLAYQLCGLA